MAFGERRTASVNDKDSGGAPSYNDAVRPLLVLLALLLPAAGKAQPCIQPATRPCAIAPAHQLRLQPGINVIGRAVTIPPESLPLERPLAVTIAALASSEVYWNGRLVGRNGIPSPTRSGERAGRYFASISVPAALLRPGVNQVKVRMSAEHLWLPVMRPVHRLEIGPYETPVLPDRSHYLPALLMLGAIAAAFVYFAAAAIGTRERAPLLLAAIAGTAMLQLGLEVSRAFIAYLYPWHLARVSGIALIAAATATLVAAYATERFAPRFRGRAIAATAGISLAFILFAPPFDFKAMGAILTGIAALAFCGSIGVRNRIPKAHLAIVTSVAALLLMYWQATGFLDQAYYVILGFLLVALVAEQVSNLRAARAEGSRATALEEQFREAEAKGEPIVQLKDGNRIHRVALCDILFARGADDYCEVQLKDGRNLLVTTGLTGLQKSRPGDFVRVHKSYVVNRALVQRVEPRPGGGRILALDGGAIVPVGRSYKDSLAAWFDRSEVPV